MHMTISQITSQATWSQVARWPLACMPVFGASSGDVARAQGDPPPPHPARGPEGIAALSPVTVETATDAGGAPVPEGIQTAAGRWTYQSFRDGNWEVYAGSDDPFATSARLTADPAADLEPRLSPDANRIVFASKRSGNYDSWVMNANGSGQRQLTNDVAADSAPAWSPDGTKFAFASDRGGNTDVYVMNADGSGLTRLTTQSGYDGAQIAFVSKRSSGATDYFLYTMTAQGGRRLCAARWPMRAGPAGRRMGARSGSTGPTRRAGSACISSPWPPTRPSRLSSPALMNAIPGEWVNIFP